MSSLSKGANNLRDWFEVSSTELTELFSHTQTLTEEAFNRQITIFHPGTEFPSISITGHHCKLNCQHCARHFLQAMHAITTPQNLIAFCEALDHRGGVGCLISGGCDDTGTVPLTPFLPALAHIKRSSNLFLNVHTGFLTDSQADELSQTGIDCASVDVVGDDSTIQLVYGLQQRTTKDYFTTLTALRKHRISTAPHICVGLRNGKLVGEFDALQLIKQTIEPRVIVIIALMPTKGTPMSNSPPPHPYDIARICAIARLLFPKTEIALGCMRPRGRIRHQTEQLAVQAGVTRLVQPTRATLQYLEKNDYTVIKHNACCVI
ncbi:MAG: radical SAM protein [Promethearchaeota archaeon]